MQEQNKKENFAMQTDGEIQLTDLVFRLMDNAVWILVLAAVCAALLGLFSARSASAVYSSTAKLFWINTSDENLSLTDLQVAGYLLEDYLAVFSTQEVHRAVAEEMQHSYSAAQLRSMVSISNLEETHIITITVIAPNAEDAGLLAEAYARIGAEAIEKKLNVPRPAIFEEASEPQVSYSSSMMQSMIVGAMIGIFIGCVAVAVHGILDDRIRVPEDLKGCFGLDTLGAITKQRRPSKAETDPSWFTGEKLILKNWEVQDKGQNMLDTICGNLLLEAGNKKIIAVTGSRRREGKTYLTIQIARNLVSAGKRVLVVDANIRSQRKAMDYLMAAPRDPAGLEDYLFGKLEASEVLRPTNMENLFLIPRAGTYRGSSVLLSEVKLSNLMDGLAGMFDMILVDAAVDTANILSVCNGIVFVTRYKKTNKRDIALALEQLARTDRPILGCIINGVKFDCIAARRRYRFLRKG